MLGDGGFAPHEEGLYPTGVEGFFLCYGDGTTPVGQGGCRSQHYIALLQSPLCVLKLFCYPAGHKMRNILVTHIYCVVPPIYWVEASDQAHMATAANMMER